MLHYDEIAVDDHHHEDTEGHEEPAHHESENGFRKTGEECGYDFECISGKCLPWLGKAPVCMPF